MPFRSGGGVATPRRFHDDAMRMGRADDADRRVRGRDERGEEGARPRARRRGEGDRGTSAERRRARVGTERWGGGPRRAGRVRAPSRCRRASRSRIRTREPRPSSIAPAGRRRRRGASPARRSRAARPPARPSWRREGRRGGARDRASRSAETSQRPDLEPTACEGAVVCTVMLISRARVVDRVNHDSLLAGSRARGIFISLPPRVSPCRWGADRHSSPPRLRGVEDVVSGGHLHPEDGPPEGAHG